MNFKIILLAVVLSALLVEAVPGRRSESHGHRRHHKKCIEVTTTTTKRTIPTTPTTTSTTPTTTSTTPTTIPTTPTTIPTTVPPTTTLAPILSGCSLTRVVNSTSGKYLKTLCLVKLGYNTDQANNYCISNNMALLRLTDATIVNANNDFLFSQYGFQAYPGLFIFILNGYRQNATSNWAAYSDPSVPLYSGLVWDATVNTQPFPQCALLVEQANNTFISVADTCSHLGHFICEF